MPHDERLLQETDALIRLALAEDVGQGDVTSQLLISEHATADFRFRTRQPMVMAGGFLVARVYALLQVTCEVPIAVADGKAVEAGSELLRVSGKAQGLLTGERVALNLLQRACGIATLTQRYVKAVEGMGVTILDTRKTMPGMRQLDKYAVRCGGGENHRMRLDDRILIKDNHIAVAGGITAAVEKARAGASDLKIEVECDTPEQFHEALGLQVDWIMLDNMPPALMAELANHPRGMTRLEASGGITLENVRQVAETGVDAISIGALTHSAPAMDIGLDTSIGNT